MATKDDFLLSKNKQQIFGGNLSTDAQYSNLNLNQNNYCFSKDTVINSKIFVTNESRKTVLHLRLILDLKMSEILICNEFLDRRDCNYYFKLSDFNNYESRKDSFFEWSNSKQNIFEQQKEIFQKEKNGSNKSKNNNSSTLSLHITAYENSVEAATAAASESKNMKSKNGKKTNLTKNWKNANYHFFDSSSVIQNSFEFPRHQKEHQNMDPEVMQFKASQRLLNPNQVSMSRNNRQKIRSIGQLSSPFRHIISLPLFLPLYLFSRGRFNMKSRNFLQLRQKKLQSFNSHSKPLPCLIPSLRGTTFIRSISTSSSSLLSMPSLVSSETNQKSFESNGFQQNFGPKKEILLTIDWILQGLAPQFMKTRLQPIFEKMDSEVDFIDEIFGYRTKGISQLGIHITKIRAYFRWKSPYNKTAYKGSYLFENDNYVVLLWGLETMDSSFWTYFPSFITGKETPLNYLQGALHLTVSPEGKITKIINRKISESDIKFAKEFGDLKISENVRFEKEDQKRAETELKNRAECRGTVMSSLPSKSEGINQKPPSINSSKIVATNVRTQIRTFSTASDCNMPEMHHLEHVQKRLEYTIPLMFRQKLDFTFYHRDIFYDNQILNMQDYGLDNYMKHLGRISVAGQLAMPYITMTPLSINLVREDGSVRVRWRIAYLTWLDSFNLKNFKAEYREKNARWYDGNAAFYVGADGFVYKVIIQKLTPNDESFTKKSTKKLVEKIGILPQNSTANFVPSNSKKNKF